jgi:hypothetical protein
MPPDNTSSAGSLYEYEPCNTKQKLHYQKIWNYTEAY